VVQFRQTLRRAAWTVFPDLVAERDRRRQLRFQECAGVRKMAQRVMGPCDNYVVGGPFKGMMLPPAGDRILDPVAKMVGSYEAELHSVIEDAIQMRPPVFINLGAADGYYAVGFARRSSSTEVHAFELAPSARRVCRKSARSNGVAHQVVIHRRATAGSLTNVPLANAVILCDCEGAELDIFTEAVVPLLGATQVTVELHEAARPGVTAALTRRFAPSHECRIDRAQRREDQVYPSIRGLSETERHLALNELRFDGLAWATFRPRGFPPDHA
jgi:hypothetical protein